ncbi:MAG: RDD family protein [Planctomycetes bacterium]|nr:RDD family protein [Planctomycetota bacterium]HPF14988.1 RDD family protein [Planctomycetota bacterium]HRV80320.1 RDD family protein [Planctomycetota bacterium]
MSDEQANSGASNPFAAPRTRATRTEVMRLASLGQRLGGAMFDQLLPAAAILLALFFTGDLGSYVELLRDPENPPTDGAVFSPASNVAILAISIGFMTVQLYFLFRESQTIGKRIVGTRIHRTSGARASGMRILLLRGLVPVLFYMLPFLGPGFMIIGYLMIFGSNRRCLHDYVAGTVVLQA